MGFVPSNTMIDWKYPETINCSAKLDAGFIICNIIYIKSATHIFMEMAPEGFNFYPRQVDFNIDAGLKIDWLSFGFRHFCYHPIISEYDNINRGYLEEGNEIYFKIEKKITLF